MINVSQTAIEAVVRDMESGNTDYVQQFFEARPDWLEDNQQEKTTGQSDNKQAQDTEGK